MCIDCLIFGRVFDPGDMMLVAVFLIVLKKSPILDCACFAQVPIRIYLAFVKSLKLRVCLDLPAPKAFSKKTSDC
jgi:hypothetical protein